MRNLRLFFSIFFIILSSCLFSSELSFRNITVENGLNSNTVNCILKDYNQFVWLGTSNGLNRFDGYDIISVSSFENKSVVSFCEPDSVHLYVATERDVYVYNRKENKTTKYEKEEGYSLNVKKIKLSQSLHPYFITNKGLFTLDETEIIPLWKDSISSSNIITDFLFDNTEQCWLTTHRGLIQFDLNTHEVQTFLYSPNEIFLNNFSALDSDENSTLYIGCSNKIVTFDTEDKRFSPLIELDNNQILDIQYIHDTLYTCTNGGGVKVVDLKTLSYQSIAHDSSNPESISSNAVYSFLLDNNTYWVGTFVGGLNYTPVTNPVFSVYTEKDLLDTSGMNVRSLFVQHDEKIIGTRSGFIYATGKKIHSFNSDNSTLKSNIILSVFPFDAKYLIGTYGGGLYIFNPLDLSLDIFQKGTLFEENSFYSITSDSKGNVWFGTLNGLIKYIPSINEYNVYNISNSGLINNDIYTIAADQQDRIWIGTNEGVCFYEKEKISLPEKLDLSFVNTVRYITEDSKGNIWIGCEREGVLCVSKELDSFEHFTETNILPNNSISSIAEDKEGWIWICTAKGIVRYNKENKDYTIFSLSDGLPWYTFNPTVQISENGNIWFGNEKGLITLHPSDLNKKRHPSFIKITGISIEGQHLEAGSKELPFSSEYIQKIKLRSSQNNMIINFSDFSYTLPQTEVFEYTLDGQSDNWQKDINNVIHLSNIPTGVSRLLIRKAGSDQPQTLFVIEKSQSYTYLIFILLTIGIMVLAFFFHKQIRSKKKNTSPQLPERKKYQNLKIDKDEQEDIKQSLILYIEKEKPYLNSNLKLDDVAKAVKYPKAKISQVLNQYLNTNFADLINTYRIEAFKEKAQEGLIQQYTLSALAKECGFSSRSSFFHSFKKIVGQTPLEYLKDAGIVMDKEN